MINKIPSFLKNNPLDLDLNSVSDEFERVYKNGIATSSYDNVVAIDCRSVLEFGVFNNILTAIRDKFGIDSKGYEFNKLWLVKTKFVYSDKSTLPYVPHIDYSRFFKVMVYLDKVTKNDGPFNYYPSDPESYEEFRSSLKKDYKDKQENCIKNIALNQFITCCGSAGSVAIFDTNCPHFAGAVVDGGSRRVLRFDFSLPEWNARNVKSNIFNGLLHRYHKSRLLF